MILEYDWKCWTVEILHCKMLDCSARDSRTMESGKGTQVQKIWVYTHNLVCRLAASYWSSGGSSVTGPFGRFVCLFWEEIICE